MRYRRRPAFRDCRTSFFDVISSFLLVFRTSWSRCAFWIELIQHLSTGDMCVCVQLFTLQIPMLLHWYRLGGHATWANWSNMSSTGKGVQTSLIFTVVAVVVVCLTLPSGKYRQITACDIGDARAKNEVIQRLLLSTAEWRTKPIRFTRFTRFT